MLTIIRYSFLEVTSSMVKEAGSINGAIIDQLVKKVRYNKI